MDDTTTIVLLHGATSSPRIWQSVVPALTGRHTVLTPTVAGHLGGPPLPQTNGKVVERIVDDMCDQLDEAGVGSAHLVGNLLGGWVALELARRGRARSVLAFSPAVDLPRRCGAATQQGVAEGCGHAAVAPDPVARHG